MPESVSQHCLRPVGRASAVLVCAAVAWAVLITSAFGQPLQAPLEQLAASRQLGAASVGVVILDADAGMPLAGLRSDERFIPASNMKLLTSGVALHVLSPRFEFRTTLEFDEAGRRLIVRGAGDPAFGDPVLLEDMGLTPEAFVDVWATAAAEALREAEMAGVDEIVIDDRVFDRVPVHETWPVEQLNRWYCAEVSGLNFHTNCVSVYPRPSVVAGQPALLNLVPELPWLEIENKTRTVSQGKHTAWAARGHMSNDISVFGDVRFASDPIEVTVHDPALQFGRLLAHRLSLMEVEVGTVRLADPDESLPEQRVLHTVRSPMETVLRRINVRSQNMYAESVLKRIGAEVAGPPGSWDSGSAIVRMVINDRLGPSAGESLVAADGSGMSRENRVTPGLLADWLRSFHDDEALGPELIASMPGPGEGTLRTRFQSARLTNEVRAKSGYLRGVSALSGYVTHEESGRRVVFAVMVNDPPSGVARATIRRFEEQVVELADQWLSEQVMLTSQVTP
ncbi:MAG: D-alanyl-D-alanine carboxypeptidase/D-alanyl-D-alanine-endopeptidase [Planctomycetota bacterium]